MIGLKLRIQILLLIRCIDELMKTCSISLIGSEIAHGNYVPTNSEVFYGQSDLLVLEVLLLRLLVFIDCQLVQSHCVTVQEQFFVICWQCFEIEIYLCLTQIVVSFLECKRKVVLNVTHKLGTSCCLDLRKTDMDAVIPLIDDNVLHREMLFDDFHLCLRWRKCILLCLSCSFHILC